MQGEREDVRPCDSHTDHNSHFLSQRKRTQPCVMCFFCAQIICDTWMSPSWAEVKETKRRIERRTSKNKGLRYRAPKRRSAEPKLCALGERRCSHLPRVTLKLQAVTTWSEPQTKSKGPAPFCKKLLQCSIEWFSFFFLINL